MTRESLQFDVVIVGAGPAGLAAACRLGQIAQERSLDWSIAVVEKGAEVGSHIVSGAVVDPRAIDELFPDWRDRGAPLGPEVGSEEVVWLRDEARSASVPDWLVPRALANRGCFVASVGRLSRWLASEAETLGCDILTGFAATELLLDERGHVVGVATGPMGLAADGSRTGSFDPGYELKGRYVLLAEGCHGNLGRQAERRFGLRDGRDPQHYGLGFKEVWTLPAESDRAGHVLHSLGWPLDRRTEGGGFVYHDGQGLASVGFVVALNYRNPWLDPYEEFQRFKQHPRIRAQLAGARRIGFGAKAVNKGGLGSLPKLSFPGGLLIGCDAGFLNGARIKGTHTAIKSGMLAAETVAAALVGTGEGGRDLSGFESAFRASWLYAELRAARNFSAGIARFGVVGGGALAWVEHNLLRGRTPVTLSQPLSDADRLESAAAAARIDYPRPDGVVSFDRASSLHLANIDHRENQPCHLLLDDPELPLRDNLPRFGEPAVRYCPAGVYEVVDDGDTGPVFRIHAANCLHCKTCEIKDPAGNIRWTPPEGGSGPGYTNL